ncbi:flavin reductase family protein [Streptomyces sp. NPDC002044]|uniref:flavin reductase family protein n=1 Tax=Streptomyces sp. NPDC002044 TaxID=3154662 RepID=UPI00331E8C04
MPHHSAPHPAAPQQQQPAAPDAPDESAAAGSRRADLRPFMAAFPTGVSVVTTLDSDAAPHGLTCSSVASVALEPPTLVVCIRAASPTLAVLLAQGHFALNLLHERARGTSDLFASGAPDRFDRTEWRLPLGAGGPHLTEDAHAVADCAVVRTVRFGDHTAVFAEVGRVTVRDDPQPLLYGLRRYALWSDAASAPPPAAALPASLPAAPLVRPAATAEGGTRVIR